jgi:hypothetical protein
MWALPGALLSWSRGGLGSLDCSRQPRGPRRIRPHERALADLSMPLYGMGAGSPATVVVQLATSRGCDPANALPDLSSHGQGGARVPVPGNDSGSRTGHSVCQRAVLLSRVRYLALRLGSEVRPDSVGYVSLTAFMCQPESRSGWRSAVPRRTWVRATGIPASWPKFRRPADRMTSPGSGADGTCAHTSRAGSSAGRPIRSAAACRTAGWRRRPSPG